MDHEPDSLVTVNARDIAMEICQQRGYAYALPIYAHAEQQSPLQWSANTCRLGGCSDSELRGHIWFSKEDNNEIGRH